jgi:hypothetical protein
VLNAIWLGHSCSCGWRGAVIQNCPTPVVWVRCDPRLPGPWCLTHPARPMLSSCNSASTSHAGVGSQHSGRIGRIPLCSAPAPRQLQLPASLGQPSRCLWAASRLVPARCSSGQGEGPHEPGEDDGTTTPATGESSGAKPEEKESDVQAAIADILNMEIRKAKVKEVSRHASAMQAPCNAPQCAHHSMSEHMQVGGSRKHARMPMHAHCACSKSRD